MKISVEGVTKTYGDVTALEDVTFDVEQGSTFGLLGTNGAGKTTLFKLLVSHDRPDAGRLTVGDTDVESAGRQVRELVGYLPQRIGFPGRLTGREVLTFTANARRMSAGDRVERIDEVLETVGLAGDADRSVSGYSGGMVRRLGLATAILARPPVLVLDEPTAGLDPEGVAEFHAVIEEIRDRTDATVIFSSHVLPEVESLCDSVAILHDGRVRTTGSIEALERDLGDLTVVSLRVDDADAAAAAARDFGTVTVDGRTVRVKCPGSAVIDLLAAVGGAVTVERVDTETPGLESIFRDAVGLADGEEVAR